MATLRQRYVDTASSGGDGTTTALSGTNAAYASLQAALNAERGDLVSADVYLRIECAADTGTADTTLVDQNIAGWTTDATRYVEIHAAAGHEAGVEWDTSKYRLSRSGTGGSVFVAVLADMSGGIAYGRLHGLQIEADWSNLNSATRTVGNLIWSVAAGTSGSDVRIYNNHFRWTGTKAFTFTNTSAMVSGSPWTNGASPTPKAYLWNNILSDETTVTAHASATTFINWDNRNHDTYLWNNTLRGALPYGFYGDNGSDRLHYLKNNLVAGVTTAMCLGSYSNARCNYNSTSSAALGYTAGANDRVSQTFTFASATNHAITSGDAGAKDYGVTDPGAGMFDDDILGVTRSGTWDIGAHEYTSSEVPTGTSGGLVVGSETSFVGEGFVGSIEAEGSGYTLTAAAGTYTLTGQAATLQASRLLAAAQGSYGLSGQDAALRKAYPLTAAQGSYALTGQPAGLAVARVITAAQGSYALTGIAANLVYGKTLAAEQGTYSLSGQAAGVRLARVMAASQGSYTLSGQPAGLRATRTLTAAQGAYTLSGQTANLFAARRLTAEQGAYTLTGIAAGLIYSGSGPVLIAGMGGYSLTGQAAALRRSAVLTAAQGAYALDGQPAGLVYGKRMAADAGGYTITGQAATLRTARVLAAATGFYTLDGQPANLVHSGLPFEPEAESATGGWAHYFRAEQAALRRKHLRALAEEAEEASEREALAEALETALIADGTATQGDVDRLRLDQIAALYTDRTLLDRRAQRALAYAERSRTELATRLALRELQRQQEDEELAVLLVLAID